MAGIYWNDIKTILQPGVTCMRQVTIGTEEGVFVARLDDYETVKRLHKVIRAALNAWRRNAAGDAWLRDSNGRGIPTKAHPMPPPPRGPMAIEDVDAFIAWVDDGMPEEPPPIA